MKMELLIYSQALLFFPGSGIGNSCACKEWVFHLKCWVIRIVGRWRIHVYWKNAKRVLKEKHSVLSSIKRKPAEGRWDQVIKWLSYTTKAKRRHDLCPGWCGSVSSHVPESQKIRMTLSVEQIKQEDYTAWEKGDGNQPPSWLGQAELPSLGRMCARADLEQIISET